MSGLSLASHPRLAGAGAHGANPIVCALLCALVLRARFWGFACFASCRSPLLGTRVPALTHLLAPTRLVWAFFVCSLGGVLAEACCGACLLVGGWVALFRVRVGVCAGGVGVSLGRRDVIVPPPLALGGGVWVACANASLLACAYCVNKRGVNTRRGSPRWGRTIGVRDKKRPAPPPGGCKVPSGVRPRVNAVPRWARGGEAGSLAVLACPGGGSDQNGW